MRHAAASRTRHLDKAKALPLPPTSLPQSPQPYDTTAALRLSPSVPSRTTSSAQQRFPQHAGIPRATDPTHSSFVATRVRNSARPTLRSPLHAKSPVPCASPLPLTSTAETLPSSHVQNPRYPLPGLLRKPSSCPLHLQSKTVNPRQHQVHRVGVAFIFFVV